MLAELAPELSLERLEVDRLHVRARATIDARLITDDLAPERFREATDWLAEVALEELDNGRGEVELLRALEHVVLGQVVVRHELREVADDLGRGRDLDDVAAELVRLDVLLLDLGPLRTEPELLGLELYAHMDPSVYISSLW